MIMIPEQMMQEIFSPSKTATLEKGKNILQDNGFVYMDYITSLQGPTFIFTTGGRKKLTAEISKAIKDLGIKIL
jgi:hypothetical protein